MTLTRTDLSKIGQVVDKRLKPLEKTVKGINNRLGSVEKGVNLLKKDVTGINTRLKSVEKDVKKIKKGTKIIVDYFDTKNINLNKRVERIEDHFSLPPMPEHAFA